MLSMLQSTWYYIVVYRHSMAMMHALIIEPTNPPCFGISARTCWDMEQCQPSWTAFPDHFPVQLLKKNSFSFAAKLLDPLDSWWDLRWISGDWLLLAYVERQSCERHVERNVCDVCNISSTCYRDESFCKKMENEYSSCLLLALPEDMSSSWDSCECRVW